MKKYRKIFIFLAVIALILSTSTTVFADNQKSIKAYFKNIKIFKDNNPFQIKFAPFIVDGTTYVPLRELAELLDKDIEWDGLNYMIHIRDRWNNGNASNNPHKIIQEQQEYIARLEERIKYLESKLDNKLGLIDEIDEMEEYLNKEYGKYKGIKFDVELDESKYQIEVVLDVDYEDYKDELKKLGESGIKEYLQLIVNDVRSVFPKKAVSGYIEDSSEDNKLLSFIVNTKGKVEVKIIIDDIEELEYFLDKKYSDKNGIKSISLDENRREIELILKVNKGDWNNLSFDKQDDILEDIYDDIRYYFDDEIEGEIRDNYNNKLLYEFDFDSKGNVTVY